MNHLKVILILLLKNISSEIIRPDIVANAINDEISSISSQIAKQTEVILEVVLSDISKLIDSVMSMKQGNHTVFLGKKNSIKQKMDSPLTNTQKYLTN